MTSVHRSIVAVLAMLALVAAACGSDTTTTSTAQAPADAPTVAVTTNILGDVVRNIVGDQMNVTTIMPVGADPHDFQASAQQVNEMTTAVAIVANGAAFEEGLLDVIETAEDDGVPVYEAIATVATLEFGEDSHGHEEEGEEHEDEEHEDEEHGDEEHEDEEHEDEEHEDEEHEDEEHEDEEHEDEGDEHAHEEEGDGHAHDGADPHFFTDPARMALAVDGIADFLIDNVDGVDTEAIAANADAYIGELEALDSEVVEILAPLDDGERVLITNHEVFGYFADRYDFEVVGAVIPSGSTTDGTSAEALNELAHLIEDEGVGAIFGDTSSSSELVETLAAEVGDISVVELYSESLGDDSSDGATYVDMVRTNANRIAEALDA